jgi:hypothetical protein
MHPVGNSQCLNHKMWTASRTFASAIPISICLGCGQLPETPPPGSRRTFATPRESDLASAPTVEYCQLVAQSASYHLKLVRVSGRLRTAFEESTFYSPTCPDREVFFWLDEAADRFSGGEAVARIGGPASYGRRERDLVVVGEFEDGIVEQRGYGHMGGYPAQLIVFRVEK